MNKRIIINLIVDKLKKDLEVLNHAAQATYQGAIHADSRAEDQYDTRGLEASYLAGAQSKRVEELEGMIHLFQFIDIKNFGPKDKISATALVGLQSEGKVQYYLLMPKGGGLQVQAAEQTIQVLTPQSPIGEMLLGKRLNDEFEVQIQRKIKDYEIVSVE